MSVFDREIKEFMINKISVPLEIRQGTWKTGTFMMVMKVKVQT